MKRFLTPLAAFVLASAALARADIIVLTDGERLTGVTVLEETLSEVRFEREGSESTVPSEEVLHVEFERLPDLLDEARSLFREEDILGALDLIEEFIGDNVPRMRTRSRWAPAYAAWRAVELHRQRNDAEGVIEAAATLIQTFPESRYVPQAHLAKAEFEARSGNTGASEETLVALDDLARDRGLKRWELASRLARQQAAAGERSADQMREAYRNLAASASDYPTVRAQARVAEAETYLAETSGAGLQQAQALRAQARPLLQQVIDDPRAGPRARAGAHTGMAECLYYEGAASGDRAVLEQAALHGLRVAVLYRGETDYLPKCLFFAFRSFDVLKDRGRKADMLAELEASFPESPWAAEARKYR